MNKPLFAVFVYPYTSWAVYGVVTMTTLNPLRLFIFLVVFFCSSQVFAVNLSGTIYGGPSALEGATVTIMDENKTALESKVTDVNGEYIFQFLDAGTYFVAVSTPSGSIYGMSSPEQVLVGAVDGEYNVVLVVAAYSLSGYVVDVAGNPLEGADVYIYDQSTNDQVGNIIQADVNGYYEVGISAGEYKFKIEFDRYDSSSYIGAPGFLWSYYLSPNTVVADDAVQNITVALVLISGQIIDSAGTPVAGVEIQVEEYSFYNGSTGYHTIIHNSGSIIADENGNYAMAMLIHNDYTLILIPPTDRQDLGLTAISNFSVTADANVNLTIENANILSGYTRDLSGNIIDSVTIWIYDQASGERIGAAINSDETGFYSIGLSAGEYKFYLYLNRYSVGNYPGIPDYAQSYYIHPNTIISNDISMDLIVPLVSLSGRIIDGAGNPVIGAELYIEEYISNTAVTPNEYHSFIHRQGSVVSDENGNYTAALFVYDDYTISVIPPADRPDLGVTVYNAFAISGSMSSDFVLDNVSVLSGYVQDLEGNPIDDVYLRLHDQLITHHSVRLTNLSTSTVYYITVSATDSLGNGPTLSA
ncbi:MAG TPA: hypothetical protein ENI05_07605, partial [Porticoccus sp.]|nr:hypothetical protein [Porticoccus sp.]